MDGDARETINDGDQDGVSDTQDNCPLVPNADQLIPMAVTLATTMMTMTPGKISTITAY
ncbi:MAG: hypothetical protein ACI9JM_000795 [Halioglobus sp.]|jgi:hypothetical protein